MLRRPTRAAPCRGDAPGSRGLRSGQPVGPRRWRRRAPPSWLGSNAGSNRAEQPRCADRAVTFAVLVPWTAAPAPLRWGGLRSRVALSMPASPLARPETGAARDRRTRRPDPSGQDKFGGGRVLLGVSVRDLAARLATGLQTRVGDSRSRSERTERLRSRPAVDRCRHGTGGLGRTCRRSARSAARGRSRHVGLRGRR